MLLLRQSRLRKRSVKVVVGLGNPGQKYEGTPHNVGFAAVERLGQRYSGSFRRALRFKAEVAKVSVGSESVLLVKPQTFMNLSADVAFATLSRSDGSVDLVVCLFAQRLKEFPVIALNHN